MPDNDLKFNSLGELINLVIKYKDNRKRPRYERIPFNLDLGNLIISIPSLIKLNNLIGMDLIKKNILDQILFYSQGLNTNEMMHTCLMGPPGVGKTTLGKILSELYCSLGFLDTDKFKIVSSVDLVAGFVGQSAIKTQTVLEESLGGVLFIDEAYSLSNGNNGDSSYSKEVIDTINKFLSENTTNFIMIIAGYNEELERCFFSLNKGLRRRFTWNYDISKYSTTDLKNIFIYQVTTTKWKLDHLVYDMLTELFIENKLLFENNGGDTLILFDKSKICHSSRVFGKDKKYKMILNITDITGALKLFKEHKLLKCSPVPYGMYI